MRVREERERARPKEGVFFYHCSISREERGGTLTSIARRKKRLKQIRKRGREKKGRKEPPADRSITLRVRGSSLDWRE